MCIRDRCSHISGHGVAAAVVAVKFSPSVSSFPEPGLAASVVVVVAVVVAAFVVVAVSAVVEQGFAACWIILHSFIAFVMLT